MLAKAKVFWMGRPQGVRLPKQFRVEHDEVRFPRHGQAVLLEPIAMNGAWSDALVGPTDQDFQQAAGGKSDEQQRLESDLFD